MRKLALTTSLALLAACGGGGGDGGGVDVSIARVTPAALTLIGIAGLPAPRMHLSVAFSGDLGSLNGRTVYIRAVVSGGPAYFDPTFAIDQANETLELDLEATSPEPAEASYGGYVTISLCLDAGCTRQLGRSPWDVPFTMAIEPGIRFSPAELLIEAPFGELPAPRLVDVILPAGAYGASLDATQGSYLQVYGRLGATGYEVTPALAPAGTYTASADVQAGVPDPSAPSMSAQLRASLPITYRVLEDATRPVLVFPAARRFQLAIQNRYGAFSASDTLTMLQQVPGGSLEIVEARHLAAPAAAAGHPLATTWLTFGDPAPLGFQASACTGTITPVCLPPGDYRAALVVRYRAAGGATTDLEVPVELVVDPCCEGTCVDLQADTANCGACFNACGPGHACSAGQCECGAGKIVCDGVCVDPQTSGANCGACGNVCRGAQTCVDGSCCPAGQTACGDRCFDLLTSASACGACGVQCPAPRTCSGGDCACSNGGVVCGAACKVLESDPQNCGGCGVACNPDQACLGGQCTCPAGETACFGWYCAPLATDVSNCGACGVTCALGETCQGGACACPAGAARCGGGACVDLASDAWHCGACDAACPAGQACRAGACAVEADAFTQLGAEPGHSGVNAGETGVPPLTPAWSVPDASNGQPPLVRGGRVVTGRARMASALQASTGAELWRKDYWSGAVAVSWPAVGGGAVYQHWIDSSQLSHLEALDLGTGQAGGEATYASQWQWYATPLVVGDALFTGGGPYGGLRGFDLSPAPAERFFADLHGEDRWSPAWRDGLVYTLLGGTLRAHDPATGAAVASRALPLAGPGAGLGTAPVFGPAQGYVIAWNQDGASLTLHAFAPGTLDEAWTATGIFRGWPAAAGGEVYVVAASSNWTSGWLEARDAATGAVRWTFGGDGRIASPPVIAAGFLYVASDANVYAIELATRQQVWSAPVGGQLAIGGGMLFVGSQATSTLHAFRLTR